MDGSMTPMNSKTNLGTRTPDAFFGRTVEDVLNQGLVHSFQSNILHDDKEYIIEVAVPGLSRRDIEITLEGNVLWIYGERKVKRVFEDVTEFNSTHFRRSFFLPEDSDVNKVSATCNNGLLTITIGKVRSSKKGRQILVQGAAGEPVAQTWWDKLKGGWKKLKSPLWK